MRFCSHEIFSLVFQAPTNPGRLDQVSCVWDVCFKWTPEVLLVVAIVLHQEVHKMMINAFMFSNTQDGSTCCLLKPWRKKGQYQRFLFAIPNSVDSKWRLKEWRIFPRDVRLLMACWDLKWSLRHRIGPQQGFKRWHLIPSLLTPWWKVHQDIPRWWIGQQLKHHGFYSD